MLFFFLHDRVVSCAEILKGGDHRIGVGRMGWVRTINHFSAIEGE
jgi:hypothetical protein